MEAVEQFVTTKGAIEQCVTIGGEIVSSQGRVGKNY